MQMKMMWQAIDVKIGDAAVDDDNAVNDSESERLEDMMDATAGNIKTELMTARMRL